MSSVDHHSQHAEKYRKSDLVIKEDDPNDNDPEKSKVKMMQDLAPTDEVNDYDDPRGFHVFDTETRELEFVPNPYTIFKKLMYDDTNTNYDKLDISNYNQKFVKLIVSNKTLYSLCEC